MSSHPSRRRLVGAGLSALSLAACGRKPAAAPEPATPAAQAAPGTLEWAVAGPWRDGDVKQGAGRHPLQTLQFFGLTPGMTVVEMWPGVGWQTQILAPFLKSTGGKLIAASFQAPNAGDVAATTVANAFRHTFEGRPDLYGQVAFTTFGPMSPPLAMAGSVDMVLFTLTLHSWMAAGLAEKAFRDAFAALKPGGVLGVEAYRGEAGPPQDPAASNGYVQEVYVRQLAKEAGFRFDKASEINANPKDARKTAPVVGESDRMTLRFVKP